MREKTHTPLPDSVQSSKPPRESPLPLTGVLLATAAVTLALVLIATVVRLAGPPLLERLAATDAPSSALQRAVRAELQAPPQPTAPPSIATPHQHGGQ